MPRKSRPADNRPNILLIMPDQMRGDCLSLERHPAVLTPNIDEIGYSGVHFTRAYTTCSSCIAARRSLLVGQFPSSHGVVGYRERCRIDAPTFPQALRDAGYHTAIAGRYMHQYPYDEAYGYSTRILGSIYIDDDDYATWLEAQTGQRDAIKSHGISWNGWTARPWQFPDHLHPTVWTATQAREILNKHDEGAPLFLTVSFYSPHPPFIPPAFYMDRYLRMDLPFPAIGDWARPPENDGLGAGVCPTRVLLAGEALRSAQAGYFGLINHIDDQLYWLITDFKRNSGQSGRPWIIVFTSDHGELLGDHYRFRKGEPYEGCAKIPLLICGSQETGIQPRQVSSRPVCLEDLMPTLLELAGVPVPEGVEGASLVPILRGEERPIRPWLHSEHAPVGDLIAGYHFITDGKLKYVWRPRDGAEQLFDIDNDPHERHDLADTAEKEELLGPWRARLIGHLKDRAEGFTDGHRLISGRPHDHVLPHAKHLCE